MASQSGVTNVTFVMHGGRVMGIYYRSELVCYWNAQGNSQSLVTILRTLFEQGLI